MNELANASRAYITTDSAFDGAVTSERSRFVVGFWVLLKTVQLCSAAAPKQLELAERVPYVGVGGCVRALLQLMHPVSSTA